MHNSYERVHSALCQAESEPRSRAKDHPKSNCHEIVEYLTMERNRPKLWILSILISILIFCLLCLSGDNIRRKIKHRSSMQLDPTTLEN